MAEEARSRLGRGLASLIGDVGGEAAHVDRPRNQRKVPIEFLKPNPRNPRRAFSEAELNELAGSIKQHGVIQPIVVPGSFVWSGFSSARCRRSTTTSGTMPCSWMLRPFGVK
jgi:hypothetical protein